MPFIASVSFLSGSGLSMGDPQGFEGMWMNPAAINTQAGLWNKTPPAGLWNNIPPALWNKNPPALTNPDPPASNTNPDPPASTAGARSIEQRPWPRPTLAPQPRVQNNPPWVFGSSAALLGQALRKSRARIVRTADGALTAPQINGAATRGLPVGGTHLWRWAPEFRVKTVAGELLGRCQAGGLNVYLCEPHSTASGRPEVVFSLPRSPDRSGSVMDEQVDKVMRAATEREDRLPEILSQMQDFWPFFESITGLPLEHAPRTAELLAATHEWATHVLMQLKHAVAALRPVQRSSLVMPLIPTPGHGALPSGHATLAAYTSEMLHLLLYRDQRVPRNRERSQQLDRLARRIAFNRVVAGVHFPIDSQAGHALGTQLARLTAALAGEPGDPPARLAARSVIKGDFDLPEIVKDGDPGRPPHKTTSDYSVDPAPELGKLWQQVQVELAELCV